MRLAVPLLLLATPLHAAERVPVPAPVETALEAGDRTRAFQLASTALADCEAARPANDRCLDLLIAAANLARGNAAAEDAEALARRALAEAERFGAPPADTGAALNNLALLLASTGRFGEAEPLYRRALAAAKAGADRELELVAAGNLAPGLDAASRFVDAEPLWRRVLALREAEGGETLGPASALARNLLQQSRYVEAEPLARRVVDARLGLPPSAALAYDLALLARILKEQGRTEEALPLYRRVVAIRAQVLGEDEFRTRIARSDLATALMGAGRAEEAEPLYRAVLDRDVATDAPGWMIVIARTNLARALDTLGRHAEAEPLHRAAAATAGETLSTEEAAAIFANLAANLAAQDKPAEAESWFRRALAGRRATGIETRTDWIEGHADLGRFLVFSGQKLPEARALLRLAGRAVSVRIAAFTDFGPAARAELGDYRRIYTGQVAAAWALARQPR